MSQQLLNTFWLNGCWCPHFLWRQEGRSCPRESQEGPGSSLLSFLPYVVTF